jgi:sigma-B regulation protein RsbU (phosphoserine phosphatase)
MPTIDLFAFAVAVVICAAGIAALAGHLLRPSPRDRLLLWFGLFSGIYGVRMFFKQTLVSALGVSASTGRWVEDGLNYFILIPVLLFIEELYGLGWRRSLRWLTVAMVTFAIGALTIDVVWRDPRRIPDPSLILMLFVVIVFVAGAYAGYTPPRFDEWRVLVGGVAIFVLFVLNEHAVGARLVPWRVSAEPIGLLIQLGCFGYIALTRVFAQGRQLAAVDQEMQSARDIQASILPRDLPAIRNVRIAARYVPLTAVAGDFYDIVALSGRVVAVLVADVTGHGVPAALIASMVKVAFTAALRETDDPGALLQRMNATLCGMFERSYVTAAAAVLRPQEGILRYALAGHPSPLLLPGLNGDVVSLDERGLFLGFIPSATYTTTTVQIRSGARLILYSDGVTETPAPDGDLFGPERLSALAATERLRPCDSFADALMSSLQRFAGSASLPHDDVTLLVIDVTPPEESTLDEEQTVALAGPEFGRAGAGRSG